MAIKTYTHNIGLDMANLIFLFQKNGKESPKVNKFSFFSFHEKTICPKQTPMGTEYVLVLPYYHGKFTNSLLNN
jgi:hypothetical protein